VLPSGINSITHHLVDTSAAAPDSLSLSAHTFVPWLGSSVQWVGSAALAQHRPI
jgi:hypothetical protein